RHPTTSVLQVEPALLGGSLLRPTLALLRGSSRRSGSLRLGGRGVVVRVVRPERADIVAQGVLLALLDAVRVRRDPDTRGHPLGQKILGSLQVHLLQHPVALV